MTARSWLLALGVCGLVAVSSAQAAGIDEVYRKPDGLRIWGELAADFLGHRGFAKSYALVVGISEYSGDYDSLSVRPETLRVG